MRLANYNDIEKIGNIYEDAKNFMRKNGFEQWTKNYPSIETIKSDISQNQLYVFESNSDIYGVACVMFGVEKTYNNIYSGSWRSSEKYVTIHRIAVDKNYRRTGKSRNMFSDIREYVLDKNFNWIRIDTHRQNITMQKYLKSIGFKYCGIIYVNDGSERLAYDINIK